MEYALIKGGTVHNVIVASEEFIALIAGDWDHIEPLDTAQEQALGVGIGWGWDGAQFVQPAAAEPEPVPQLPRRLSVLAFRKRFTLSERAAIEWAAVDRADQSDAQRQQAAMLRATLADQAAASFIDLGDDTTVEGVLALQALGLLAEGRADAILGATVLPEERP